MNLDENQLKVLIDQVKKAVGPSTVEFEQLVKDVAVIKSMMGGNAEQGRAGYGVDHRRIMYDLYGTDINGNIIPGASKHTMLHRMSAMEDNLKKVLWVITGAIGLLALVKLGISAFLGKVFSK